MLSIQLCALILSYLAVCLDCSNTTESSLVGNNTTSINKLQDENGTLSGQLEPTTATTQLSHGENASVSDVTTSIALNDTFPAKHNSTLENGTIATVLLQESTSLPTTLISPKEELSPEDQHQNESVSNGNMTEKNTTLYAINKEKHLGEEYNTTDVATLGMTAPVSQHPENVTMASSTDSQKEVLSKTDANNLTELAGTSRLDVLLAHPATSLETPLSGNLTHLMSTAPGEMTSTVIDAQSVAPTAGLVSLPPMDPSAFGEAVTNPPAMVTADLTTSVSPPAVNEAAASMTQIPVETNSSVKAPSADPNHTIDPHSSFVLQFTGNTRNCSIEKQYSDLEEQIRHILRDKARVPTQKLSLNVVNCSKSFLMNVGVSKEYETNVSEFLKNLESNSTKFRINNETYHVNLLTTATPGTPDAHRQPPQVILSSRHTDIEFVIYVALGSACAFLLTLAIVLVTCKYCRTKPYKSFDLNDVSHLSHRLEDYSLRQIPRPKSVYVDYCRRLPAGSDHYSPLEEQAGNGMVHAFDTSVVPLEDVPIKEAQDANLKSTGQIEEGQIITSKPAVNHEYEEIDMNAVNSTENLHNQQPNQKASHWGVDNDSFTT